ncbi:unnamed protein product [Mycena citricolor]|uniref:Acid proteinase n=1 Tax=Mycena citricolor TaxID=2018698 RepID=A0AAD2H3K1_9AGAR|nr:unnamed protein product [Mycena citricolor]CAK5266987.1 unnamed protein product [Mycena citricolor]
MVFASALVSLLLAAAALAAPRSNVEGRQARRRMSGPRLPTEGPHANLISNATSHVAYSQNWAGASLESPSGTYTSVTGTFTVPTPRSAGGSGSSAASAWVGIDGDTCSSGIMQTGIDFNVDNGRVSFDAWYEFYPAFASDFSGFSVSAGDVITLVATKTSSTSGHVSITNESTGRSVSKTLSGSGRLCGENAEWIVEDFEQGNSLVPFANFGTVTFTNARATLASGGTVGPSGAQLLDIEQNSVLTSVSASGSSVTVRYV